MALFDKKRCYFIWFVLIYVLSLFHQNKTNNVMKATALKNKLNKMNIKFTTESNGYNVDINFSINGLNFIADYTETNEEIISFIRIICIDEQTQEMQIRSFENFNQVIKYSNR